MHLLYQSFLLLGIKKTIYTYYKVNFLVFLVINWSTQNQVEIRILVEPRDGCIRIAKSQLIFFDRIILIRWQLFSCIHSAITSPKI